MQLLTVADVAKILKCNKNYVYKLHNAGLLPLIKLGSYKCRAETLDEFLKAYEGMDLTDPFNVREL
ncbi:helix-turn-helix domain-containing protein [uncultured Phascolarctobacterium sp.]|uniref:helix-turn-helix domain-containing protein n=1 Tax=uncultured Phascolarctobacterium sp. TaxID=512296 RepID=UPI0027D94365|nr:helix-turn-helix domain-containing protein [uncultured Phascolarctobacterium sp.]